jgi:hypothetical protein
MVISTFALSHLDTHGRYLGDTPRGSTAGAFAVTYVCTPQFGRGGAQRHGPSMVITTYNGDHQSLTVDLDR